jgi:acetyltransferase-like isoleucine patch superfamily enzyme
MTISFLWKNREKANFLSARFFKIWAKRLYTFPKLYLILFNRFKFNLKGVSIGKLSIVYNFHLVGKPEYLSIGESVFVAKTVEFACHEKIEVGNYVVINDHVKILAATHDLSDPAWPMLRRPIKIGNYAWIATSAIILPGVTIGEGAVIGAGAVVSKDVPPFAIAAGNPAQLLQKKRCENLNYNPVYAIAPYEAWLGRKS